MKICSYLTFSLLLSILMSCFSCQPKQHYDRILYYHGNSSLPPPYQEHYSIEIDSSSGQVAKSAQGLDISAAFPVNKKKWNKLKRLSRKLPKPQQKQNGYMTGAALSSIRLYRSDSLLFCLDWQEGQPVSKSTTRFEKQLKLLAPALSLPLGEEDLPPNKVDE